MIDINNYYISVRVQDKYFEVRLSPVEFGDWLAGRGVHGAWDSSRSVVDGFMGWKTYRPSRIEHLGYEGGTLVVGLPFRVETYLINERDTVEMDSRDYTPIQFWLVKRGEWTEVTAVCKPPGAWPETAERLHGIFDWLIEQVESRFGDDFRWVGIGETAVSSPPGAAGEGRETAVSSPPGAAGEGRETAVDEAIRRAQIAKQYGILSKTVPMWEEIVRLYSAGLPQREIAERLDRSERTIREHIEKMRAREYLPPENSPK